MSLNPIDSATSVTNHLCLFSNSYMTSQSRDWLILTKEI